MKTTTGVLHSSGTCSSSLSCFSRWAAVRPEREAGQTALTLKIEARCKQCGETFVKYAYDRTSRCEACRKGPSS